MNKYLLILFLVFLSVLCFSCSSKPTLTDSVLDFGSIRVDWSAYDFSNESILINYESTLIGEQPSDEVKKYLHGEISKIISINLTGKTYIDSLPVGYYYAELHLEEQPEFAISIPLGITKIKVLVDKIAVVTLGYTSTYGPELVAWSEKYEGE